MGNCEDLCAKFSFEGEFSQLYACSAGMAFNTTIYVWSQMRVIGDGNMTFPFE
jgi:hypothetical protein